MGAGTLLSVEQYLNASFPDGDREYVDGRLVERNLGEVDHSEWQTAIAAYLRAHYKQLWVAVEVRVQVKAARLRVPDITAVLGGKPKGRIVTEPPLWVVEVLSPSDTAEDLQETIDDYFAFGIPFVWVVNPRTRRGQAHTPEGSREAKAGVLRIERLRIEVPLSSVVD